MAELKACPFCNGSWVYSSPDIDGDGTVINCRDCGCECNEKMWNSRPIEESMAAKIEDMQKASEALKTAICIHPTGITLDAEGRPVCPMGFKG